MKSMHLISQLQFVKKLLMLSLMTVSAQWTSAQLTLSIPHINLGNAIKQIQDQSKYRFFYDDKLSVILVGPLSVANASLENTLTMLFEEKNISFQIEENIVYLSNSSSNISKQSPKQQNITGRITDSNADPLTGVNIIIKGTQEGSISDMNGYFSITTDVIYPTFIFSYIGYETQEISIRNKTFITIELQEATQALDAVVVTALGIERQEKALSYNAQNINQKELTRVKDANFMNSLNGKVAGAKIQSSSSGVGGATKVVMRGTKSIEGNNNALYVIDGIPMYNAITEQGTGRYASRGSTEAIADLNPDDIESITILTGASATALYGSSAANGVILITTQKGKEGKMELRFTSSAEFANSFVMPEFQNTYTNSLNDATSWGVKQLSTGYTPALFFKPSTTYINSLTLSFGNNITQTYASLANADASGLIPNNGYDRYNMTVRSSSVAANNKFKIDIGAQYIMQRDQNMVNQGEYMNPLVGAYLYPRGLNWNDAHYFEQWDDNRDILIASPFPEGQYTMQNPYWVAYRNIRTSERKRFMLSFGVSYIIKKWSKTEKWDISTRYHIDRTTQEYKDKRFAGTATTLLDGGSKNGYFGWKSSYDIQNYADLITNLKKNMGEHAGLIVNIGVSFSDLKNDATINQGPLRDNGLLNIFNIQNIEQGAYKAIFYQEGWREQTQSIFGSIEANWKRLIYLTVTGRNDWASQLAGSAHKSFFYPSGGLSGVITDMFSTRFKNNIQNTLSFAKIHLAYAQVASPFQRGLTIPMNTFSQNDKKWVKEGFYPLKDFKPERTNSFEVGLSTRWLNNKINFNITYYRTHTKNQTIRAPMSPSSGYNYTYVQTGNVENQGIEMTAGATINITKDLSWDINATYDYNKNEIKELVKNVSNPQKPAEALFEKDELLKDNFGNAQIILRPGGTLGDVYAKTDFVRDTYGNIDVSQDLKPRGKYMKLGSILPDANFGWRNDFTYKRFGFGFMLSARFGGIVISATQAAMDYSGVSKATADARDAGGVLVSQGVMIPAQTYYQMQSRPKDYLAQYYTYSATNIRLREAYVSFSIPRKWLGNIIDLDISLTGKNFWMLYNKAPFDPEAIASTGNYEQGFDYFMTPSTQSFGFRINVKL